jgi:hypothetical protein
MSAGNVFTGLCLLSVTLTPGMFGKHPFVYQNVLLFSPNVEC